MLTKVIDLSHWNENADWLKVKNNGVDGVYLKCTQGIRYVDPSCIGHSTRAKSQNIKVGYYHFATLTDDPSAEARFFKSRLSTLPTSNLIPMLDVEENKTGLTPAQIETWIQSFLDAMETKVGIYSYTPFLDQFLPLTHNFGQIPLWIAQYRNVVSPQLPYGWTQSALWQYTNMGHIDGIKGTVDCSKPMNQNFVL